MLSIINIGIKFLGHLIVTKWLALGGYPGSDGAEGSYFIPMSIQTCIILPRMALNFKSQQLVGGCLIQIFSELVLTKITGTELALRCAKHLFIIFFKGKLEWEACSTKQVTPCRGLFVVPGTVMVEFPGHAWWFLFDAYNYFTHRAFLIVGKVLVFFIRGSFMPIGFSEGSLYAWCLDGANIHIIIHTKSRNQ